MAIAVTGERGSKNILVKANISGNGNVTTDYREPESTYDNAFDYFAGLDENDKSPSLKPEVPMAEAIDYLIKILFPDKNPNIGNIDIENRKAVNLITEKLRTGDLKAWGLYVGESVEREFNKDDWKYRELLPLEASIPTRKYSQTQSVASVNQHELTGLRVNFNQVKTVWPRA